MIVSAAISEETDSGLPVGVSMPGRTARDRRCAADLVQRSYTSCHSELQDRTTVTMITCRPLNTNSRFSAIIGKLRDQ